MCLCRSLMMSLSPMSPSSGHMWRTAKECVVQVRHMQQKLWPGAQLQGQRRLSPEVSVMGSEEARLEEEMVGRWERDLLQVGWEDVPFAPH